MSFRPSASAGPSAGSATGPVLTTTYGGAARKAFTPPLFVNFGKKSKDLFKKKYEFENQAKILNNTADGMSIETVLVAPTDAALRGVFKSTIPVRTLGLASGTFESTFHTVADRESTTSYKFNKLTKGLAIKLGITGIKPDVKATSDFAEGWGFAEAEYSRDFFNGSVAVRSNQAKTLVDATAALGYDSLSVGGKVTVNVADKQAPSDYNFGAQIDGADYVASAVTEKKRSLLSLSYFQSIGRGHTVGAQASFGLAKPTRSLQFGTDYQFDVDTTVRAYAKVDSDKPTTTIATNVEHRLLNPNMLLGVSAEFNVTPATVNAGKLGVALTFGDF